MSKKLYLECFSGISGDMTVATLLDLGASKEVLDEALGSLPVDGFKTRVSRVIKNGLDACDFDVILDEHHENHDHDMDYLHGQHSHKNHVHSHNHHNNDKHTHENKNNHHDHRGLADIIHIIKHAKISEKAKQIAIKIFSILGKAEAAAHGVSIDEVHFHEVGAVDSIVDIISVAVCLDNLEIEEVIVPILYEGSGFIRCQHGLIPVPVPAVSHIASDNKLKLHLTNIQGELVTPTGAAIVAAIKTSDRLPKEFSIKRVGLGAGKRTYENPSILRGMIIEDESNKQDFIIKLESNIDDCSGEALGYTMNRLLKAGAKDVYYMPIFMKKNRPAYQLSVICSEDIVSQMEQIIFEETTTIGIRKQKIERTILQREIQSKQTSLGEVKVKICKLSSGNRVYPEYDSVIKICEQQKKSYQEVYQLIVNECN